MGQGQDAQGWTLLQPSADGRIVYASSSEGNDRNDGFSPTRAVRTLARGKALLRDGRPDWLLLKRGDGWDEPLGHWRLSGRSAREMMLIGAYGQGGRPLLRTGMDTAFSTSGGGGSPQSISHIALVGLHFQASEYVGSGECTGVSWLRPGDDLLIEDCRIEGYSGNLTLDGQEGGLRNFVLRRSVIVDSYRLLPDHSQGLYANNVHGVLIEENLFDHNGWKAGVAGAEPTVFNHDIYLNSSNSGIVLRGNILARASSHGAQVRPGGVVQDNLFIANPIGLLVSGGRAQVTGNVVLEGKDLSADEPRAFGMDIGAVEQIVLRGNIIAHDKSGSAYGHAIEFGGSRNVTMERNIIHDWRGGIVGDPLSQTEASGVATKYRAPERSIGSYQASLGRPGTLEAFLAEARNQSRENWRKEYTAQAVIAYIREGFEPAGGDGRDGAGAR